MRFAFCKLTRLAALCAAIVAFAPSAGQRLLAQAAPRPAGAVKIWTCDICTSELSRKASREPKPLTLLAAKNGTFSGKVVVESTGTIRGVHATVGAISGPGGTISAKNIQVRYGKWWETQGWALPSGPDILLDTAPEVPATDEYLRSAPNGRAILPVWVTVQVPKDAKAGTYSGQVSVQAQGVASTVVPIKLEVEDWTLPDPQDYRTWMDFVESPDTLAVEYKVPLWSDKHWDLIAKSFRLLNATGGRTLYIPLIAHTNLGNEQSMVRWIPVGDGRYEFDYSVMDKYLDTAEKNLGKPKLVIFQVWDICMSKESLNRGLWDKNDATGKAREELLGKGPRVTALDPKTKEASTLILPRYEDPVSKINWRPMFAEIRKRMAARGLDKCMMLGLMPDLWPNRQESDFWNDISGNLPWAIHGHAGDAAGVGVGKKGLNGDPKNKSAGSDIGYAAFVYDLVFNVNPDKGRMYGWQGKTLLTNYLRGGDLNMASAIDIREYPAFNITGGQRGGGRLGADFWQPIRNKKGERAGAVYTRYPENNWRNLDLSAWFLAPGPDGPVATARLESLKEGLEECEGRIFLEDALLDPAKKAKVGNELAQKCQEALDELHRAMWKTVWTVDDDLNSLGKVTDGRNPPEGLWNALGKANKVPKDFWLAEARKRRSDEAGKGQEWFLQGWQDREKKIFDLSGEVAARLDAK